MDYMFYNFMNNAKTEQNRAVIESIQAGYLLCEYNRGNITKAQYESLLGDAKNWVVDKAKSIGGTVKSGLAAAALSVMLTACAGAGNHINLDGSAPVKVSDIETVIEDQTQYLNEFFTNASAHPVQVQDIQEIGKHCVALIAAQLAHDPNKYTSSEAATKTPAFNDYLMKLYTDLSDGKIVTPAIQSAIDTTKNNPAHAAENAPEIQKAINYARTALVGTVRTTGKDILPYVQNELERRYQKIVEDRKQANTTNPNQSNGAI